MQLCFFSDDRAHHFLPLTLTRPVHDLRVGMLTIREKWEYDLSLNASTALLPGYLAPVFEYNSNPSNKERIWINDRYLPTPALISEISKLERGSVLIDNETSVAAIPDERLASSWIKDNSPDFNELTPVNTTLELSSIEFLWDMLSLNAIQIEEDIKRLELSPAKETQLEKLLGFSTRSQIYISDSATIEPGCIIIAEDGPVFIGEHVVLEAGSIIKGPGAVCSKATVKMKARIYGGTTIGPVCKVAGEIHNSIFHSYSNKAHDGFVGNSIFGQWCNLGADTNTSNLKNNYSKISIINWKTKLPYDEGVQFLGTIMGDHSKTAINTQLNTGTIVGVCSNIFHSGFPPKYIPSFSWGGKENFQTYQFEKAIEAMSAMMKRRGVDLTSEYQDMMLKIFKEGTL